MKQLLEKLRLYWWERAYTKIWEGSIFKENITFSTKTDEDSNRLVSFISSNLQLEKCKVVLDIGCGNGNLGKRVFKNCDLLIQTDYSFNALKLIKGSGTSVEKYIIQSEVNNLPFKENNFDCIFLYSVIHYSGSIENTHGLIKSAMGLLKGEGRLYIGDVPIKKLLYRELRRRATKIRSLDNLKYFFSEFMQISYSIDDFLGFSSVAEIKVIPQPAYLKLSKWRVDIEIQKR